MPGDDTLKRLLRKHPRIKNALRKIYATVNPTPELGESFWKWYTLFKESEGWSLEQMREYQLDLLRNLLHEAKSNSRFYRERLAGIEPVKITSVDEFSKKVPTLSKIEFAANYSDIFSEKDSDEPLQMSQTSGTTGTPLQFYHSAVDDERELAAIFHNWNRVGFEPGKSRRVELLGLVQTDRIYEIYPDRNVLRCSILHLKPEHIREYAEAIRKYGADFMVGYPSAINLLASSIREESLAFPDFKAIFLASEELYDSQLETIAGVFPRARLMAHYGCSERLLLGIWCEHRQDYHILPHYGLAETDSETGEIIGTNLINTVNPFIRYRMSDAVLEKSNSPCPDCGRPYVPRFIRIGGRMCDYIYSNEKGFIPPAVMTYPVRFAKTIRELQIHQSQADVLVLKYIPIESAKREEIESEFEEMRIKLAHVVGESMKIETIRVETLPRGRTGKFKWIVNELNEAVIR